MSEIDLVQDIINSGSVIAVLIFILYHEIKMHEARDRWLQEQFERILDMVRNRKD